jgi:hypothetical protein
MDNIQYKEMLDRLARVRELLLQHPAAQDPRGAEALSNWADRLEAVILDPTADRQSAPPGDRGFSELIGLGPNAASDLGNVYVPLAVDDYEDAIKSERVQAMADLYYVYQHEKIGVFRVIDKLQQLFRAGAVRLSTGEGANQLYQWDRRDVLRFTKRDRLGAYCRGFGYCFAPPPVGARPNREFHHLFTHFVGEVATFWRDKRISEVIRDRATDPTFGSLATVRRAGLDLRNNLKFVSYGHLNVMTREVMGLLDDAFRILRSDDVRNLFGADTAWDVVEEVSERYFHTHVNTSARQRMAVAGRDILRWLAQGTIRSTSRTEFENSLIAIGDSAEEWLTSAESEDIIKPRDRAKVLPWEPRGGARSRTA